MEAFNSVVINRDDISFGRLSWDKDAALNAVTRISKLTFPQINDDCIETFVMNQPHARFSNKSLMEKI